MQTKGHIAIDIKNKLSQIVALKLWESGAVKVNFDNPFKLVSGKLSPIYVNCRLLISDPVFCSFFTSFSKSLLKDIQIDVIAGGETAGIPFSAFLASAFFLPMIYVRKRVKDYGIGNLVEGKLIEGQKVLLVEDLITDAGSKLNFIDAIKEGKGIVNHVLVIFDRQQGGKEALLEKGIELHSLCNLNEALKIGMNLGFINEEEFSRLLK